MNFRDALVGLYIIVLSAAGVGLLVLVTFTRPDVVGTGSSDHRLAMTLQDRSPDLGPAALEEYDVQLGLRLTAPKRIAQRGVVPGGG